MKTRTWLVPEATSHARDLWAGSWAHPSLLENETKTLKWGPEKSHRVWRCPPGAMTRRSSGSGVRGW